jgi:regulatory protein
MPVISAIEPQRRKGRYNIFVDGEFVIGVGEPVVARLRLKPGMPFAADRLLELGRAEELQRATDASARLLEIRPRSTREIRDRLKQKGFDEQVVDEAVASLTRLGYLDDAQFSRLWVESRARSKAAGARKMRSELMTKGIERSLIDDAVGVIGEGEELAIAAAIVAKKLPNPASDPVERKKQLSRLIAQLQRRGLGWGIIKQATAHLGANGESERE